jgi:hypothetical protein
MQSLSVLGAAAALALLAPAAALAQSSTSQAPTSQAPTSQAPTSQASSEARLASPGSAPPQAVISGVAWRCEGDACQGAGTKANLDGLVRECKKVVAVIGPVASYASRGRELTAGQLRACNKAAVKLQTARN